MHMKKTLIATKNGERAPDEDKRVERYQHHVTFTEVLSESMPQVALHCVVLSEYGLDMSSPWSVFAQLSSLGTSLISVCLAFGKVNIIFNQLKIIHLNISHYFIEATSIHQKQGSSWTLQCRMLQRCCILVHSLGFIYCLFLYDELLK